MTRHFTNTQLRFFLTAPSPCPYLPGRRERKVFTPLDGPQSLGLNEALTLAGFRRSQTIAYRPACEGCDACVSTRVPAQQFTFGRRWRRVLARNADLSRRRAGPEATEEQFWLLRRYLNHRHLGGGMSDMSLIDFASMVAETAVRTHIIEYRYTQGPAKGELAACALVDQLRDGFSMVYSFFDPADEKRSFGSFVILDHIRLCQMVGLAHVYLGYWVKGSEKMAYKAEFQPLEILKEGVWVPFED